LVVAIVFGLTHYDGVGIFQQLPSIFKSHIVFSYSYPEHRKIKYKTAFSEYSISVYFEKDLKIKQKKYAIHNFNSGIIIAFNQQQNTEIKCDYEVYLYQKTDTNPETGS
jgi:hypothetical protein